MPLPLMAVWKVSFRTPTSASGCVLLRRFVAQAHSTVKQNLPWAVQSFAHIVGGDRACRPAQVVSEASSRDEEIVRHGGIEGPSKLLGLAIAESKPKSEKFSCLALIAFRRIVGTSTYGGGSDQADQLRHLVQDHRAPGRSRTTRRRHSRVTVQLGSRPERNCDEHRTRLGRQ